MARQKKASGGAPVPTPLQGSLRQEGETVESTALNMILHRMEEQEKQQAAWFDTFNKTLTAQQGQIDRMWRDFDRKLSEDKREAFEAIKAVDERLISLLKEQSLSPEDRGKLEQSMLKEAAEANKQAHKMFVEGLVDAPKGFIKNDEGKDVTLIINGVKRHLPAGKRTKVEAPFKDHWEKRKAEQKWYVEYEAAFHKERDANKIQQLRGMQPVWHQEVGRLV